MDIQRKLVTIRTVSEIIPIEGADSIELAKVDGWQCVVKKGEFKAGDSGIFFEIDCLLPKLPVFDFLSSRGTKKMFVNGKEIEGYRLRTIKLRGQLSQGLLLPVTSFDPPLSTIDDWSEHLGVIKYEAPIPAELAGQAKGTFPSFIQKTDQERCQNLTRKIEEWARDGVQFEITEKLDGSSMTVYLNNGEFGVCSRNMDLIETEGNTRWRLVRELDLETKLRELGRNIALQGELIGAGVQGNPYKLAGQEFRIFDVFDIDKSEYLLPDDRISLLEEMCIDLDRNHVPVIESASAISGDTAVLLRLAEGKATLADVEREGLVFKATGNTDGAYRSFKVISNKFLLNEK